MDLLGLRLKLQRKSTQDAPPVFDLVNVANEPSIPMASTSMFFRPSRPVPVPEIKPLDLETPDWFTAIREAALSERGVVPSVHELFDAESEAENVRCMSGIYSAITAQMSIIDSLLYNFDRLEELLNGIIDSWVIVTQKHDREDVQAWIMRDLKIHKPTLDAFDSMKQQKNYAPVVTVKYQTVHVMGSTVFDTIMGPLYNAEPRNMSYDRWSRLNSEKRRSAVDPVGGVHFIRLEHDTENSTTQHLFDLPILVGSKYCVVDPTLYGHDIPRCFAVTKSTSGPMTARMYPVKLKRVQNEPNGYYDDDGRYIVRITSISDLGHTASSVFKIKSTGDASPYGTGLSKKMIGEVADEVVMAAQEWKFYRERKDKRDQLSEPDESSSDAKLPLPIRWNILIFLGSIIALQEQFSMYREYKSTFVEAEARGVPYGTLEDLVNNPDSEMLIAILLDYHTNAYEKYAPTSSMEERLATFGTRLRVPQLFEWNMFDIHEAVVTEEHVRKAWELLDTYLTRQESDSYAEACRIQLNTTLSEAIKKVKLPDLGLYHITKAVRTSGKQEVQRLWTEMTRRFVLPAQDTLVPQIRQNQVFVAQCASIYGSTSDDVLYDAAIGRYVMHRTIVSMWHSPWKRGETPEFYDSIKLRTMDMINRLFLVTVAKYEVPDKEDWRLRTGAHVAYKIVETFQIRFTKMARLVYLASKATESAGLSMTRRDKRRMRQREAFSSIGSAINNFAASLNAEIDKGMTGGAWGKTDSTAEINMAHELGTTISNAGFYDKATMVFSQFNAQSSARETRDTHPTQAVADSTGTRADGPNVGRLRLGNSTMHVSVSYDIDEIIEKVLGFVVPVFGESEDYLAENANRLSVNLQTVYWTYATPSDIEALLRDLKRNYELPFDIEIVNDGITVNIMCTSGRFMMPFFTCQPGTTLPTCYDIIVRELSASVDRSSPYRNLAEDIGGESQLRKIYEFDLDLLVGHIEYLTIREQYNTKIADAWNQSDLNCSYVMISPGCYFSLHNIVASAREHNEGPRNVYGTTTYASALTGMTRFVRDMASAGAIKKIMTLNNGAADVLVMPGHTGMVAVGQPTMVYTRTAQVSRYNAQLEDTYEASVVARASGKFSSSKHQRIKASNLPKDASFTFEGALGRKPTPTDGMREWLEENPHLAELSNFPGVYMAKLGTRTKAEMPAIAIFGANDVRLAQSSKLIPYYQNGVITEASVKAESGVVKSAQIVVETVYELTSATKAFDKEAQKKETGRLRKAYEMPHYRNSRGKLLPLETCYPAAAQPSRNTGGGPIARTAIELTIAAGIHLYLDVGVIYRHASDPVYQDVIKAHGWKPVRHFYDSWGNPIGTASMWMYPQYLSNQHWSNKFQVQNFREAERSNARDPTTGNLSRGREKGYSRGTMASQEAPLLAATKDTAGAISALANSKTSNLRSYAICDNCHESGYVGSSVAERVVSYYITCPKCDKSLTLDSNFNIVDRPDSGSFSRVIMRQSMRRAYEFRSQFTIDTKWYTAPVKSDTGMSFEQLPNKI